MSNILKNKDDLIFLKDVINYTDKKELSIGYLEEVIKFLIPHNNGENLIGYKINTKGMTTAFFSPKFNRIKICLNGIINWLDINGKDLAEFYNISDENTLKSFLFLFIITHEIEHSYQYLMGEGIVSSPSPMIRCGYKEIFDLLLPDNDILPRPIKETRKIISLILYKLKQNYYILERNANVECTDLLCKLALYMERDDILKIFEDMRSKFMCIGYSENPEGNLEETYKKILMYDRYKKFFEEVNMTEDEKARYGLQISEQTRQKILEM